MHYHDRTIASVLSMLLVLSGCSDATQFTQSGSGLSPTPPSSPEDSQDTLDASSSQGKSEDQLARQSTAESAPDLSQINADQQQAPDTSARQRFEAVCTSGTRKTLTQKIKFPETNNCRFGQAGNLARLDAHLQAIEAQTTSLVLPAKTQLCSMAINSAKSTIQYDDFMVLTLNGYVLMSSNSAMLQGLQGDATSAYQWNFARIRGVPVDFDSKAYCIGANSGICDIPVTDTLGQFQLQVDPSSLVHLADQIVDSSQLKLALIATGDNDDEDCWHTEINLDFSFEYVELP